MHTWQFVVASPAETSFQFGKISKKEAKTKRGTTKDVQISLRKIPHACFCWGRVGQKPRLEVDRNGCGPDDRRGCLPTRGSVGQGLLMDLLLQPSVRRSHVVPIKRQHCVSPAESFDSALGTLRAAVQVIGNFFCQEEAFYQYFIMSWLSYSAQLRLISNSYYFLWAVTVKVSFFFFIFPDTLGLLFLLMSLSRCYLCDIIQYSDIRCRLT